jgi:hypothetical protein
MKRAVIILGVFLVAACATPAAVKQAIVKQSDAYGELQTALQGFTENYINLNNQLFLLNRQAQDRIEMLAIVRGLSGDEAPKLPADTWAKENYNEISELVKSLDKIPPSRQDILKIYDKSVSSLENALQHSQAMSARDVEAITKTLNDVKNSQANLSKEISALVVIHDTIGEYLQIDLSPNANTLKEAITNIKAIKK